MKRLLKISFDLALLSFIPVLSWFCLSLIEDKNLINIFSLTYPIQYIWSVLKSIFATGANISKEKDKNKNAVMSGIAVGSLVSVAIFGLLAFNIEKYIEFMSMDVSIYKNFALYSVFQLLIQLFFSFILEKLQYEEKNDLANKYSITFSILNFVVLIGSALIFDSQKLIIITTLLVMVIYTAYISIKTLEPFKLQLDILKFIEYDSVEIANNLLFFFIFLFGLSNAFEFGSQYALAITFVSLITDTQWDIFASIAVAAKIDIIKNKFNYKEHRNNAYKLLLILLLSSFLMFLVLHRFYELNLVLVAIYFTFDLIAFLMYPIYKIKTCYLHLEYAPVKITINKIISSGIRMIITFVKSPFCNGLGQISSSLYQFVTINIIFNNNYIINKKGYIEKRH